MPTERVIRAPSVPLIGSAGLAPTPFQYLLTGDETVRLTVLSRAADGTTTVDATLRQWRRDTGDTTIGVERLDIAGGLSGTGTRDLTVAPGALLNLRIGTPDPDIRYGELWVRAQLVLGNSSGAIVLGTLVQGYVTPINDLAWPGSPLEKTHDAKGVIRDAFWTGMVAPTRAEAAVPTGARWRVICGMFTTHTSAVAGLRTMIMRAVSALGANYWYAVAAPDQNPSSAVIYNVGAGMPPTSLISNSDAYLPWPADIELTAGDKVIAEVGSAQAGDFVATSGLLVREWIDA